MDENLPAPIPDPPLEPVSVLYGDRFEQLSDYRTVRAKGRGDWLMILTVAGAGRVASPGRPFPGGSTPLDIRKALPGDLTCYPPDTPQDYATHPDVGTWTFLWVHFSPPSHWLPWLEEMVRPRTMTHWSLTGTLLGSVTEAWEEAVLHVRRPHPTAPLWSQWAFERILLLLHDSHLSTAADVVLPRALGQALRWGARQIGTPFRLSEWATAGGVSASRLSHLARAHLGESLQQYAERMKLQHAAHLLRLTQLRVQEIASAVGYDDAFYFSTRFRRQYGVSPRGYRRT